jgi:hypothetical protein
MNPRKLIFPFAILFLFLLVGCSSPMEVKGTLQQENGDPAVGYQLTLCLEKEVAGTCDSAAGAQYKVTTDVGGKFTYQKVADGKYFILFSPPEAPKSLLILKDQMGEPIYIEILNGKGIDLDILTLWTNWAL